MAMATEAAVANTNRSLRNIRNVSRQSLHEASTRTDKKVRN